MYKFINISFSHARKHTRTHTYTVKAKITEKKNAVYFCKAHIIKAFVISRE